MWHYAVSGNGAISEGVDQLSSRLASSGNLQAFSIQNGVSKVSSHPELQQGFRAAEVLCAHDFIESFHHMLGVTNSRCERNDNRSRYRGANRRVRISPRKKIQTGR